MNQYYQLRELVEGGFRPNLKEYFNNTEGMISFDEALLLYHLSSQVAQGCIVEVGSYRGRSTVFLARGSMDGNMVPVYTIDPHQDFVGVLGGMFGPKDRGFFYQAMLDNKCSEVVRLVNLSSEIISPGWTDKIGMLWIDGDHSYSGVMRDFKCWQPHLLPEAVIVFDDTIETNMGPRLLINELILNEGFHEMFQVGKVTVICHQSLE